MYIFTIKAVQKIHVARFEMKSDIIVEPRIDCACSESENDRKGDHYPKRGGERESEKRRRSHDRAECRDLRRSEPVENSCAEHAR